jgi:hypothetical protein
MHGRAARRDLAESLVAAGTRDTGHAVHAARDGLDAKVGQLASR